MKRLIGFMFLFFAISNIQIALAKSSTLKISVEQKANQKYNFNKSDSQFSFSGEHIHVAPNFQSKPTSSLLGLILDFKSLELKVTTNLVSFIGQTFPILPFTFYQFEAFW